MKNNLSNYFFIKFRKTRRKGEERRRREGKEEDPERKGLEESGSKEFELGEDKENLKTGFKPMVMNKLSSFSALFSHLIPKKLIQ